MLWRKGKFTFVLIPDANSPIRRLQLPRTLFYLIPAFLVLMALAASLWLYVTKMNYDAAAEALNQQLFKQKQQLAETTASKDQTIQHLQNQVLGLTEQAAKIQDKLEQLERLEQQLKKLANIKDKASSGDEQRVSITGANIGGEAQALTQKNMDRVVSDTRQFFETLDGDIGQFSQNFKEIQTALERKRKLARSTPSIWPVDSRTINSGFGIRRDPFTGMASFHGGLDIDGAFGDSVYATADGVVQFAGWDGPKGYNITIDHSNGFVTSYSHQSKILVKRGQQVKKGQVIGKVGSTGRSTGSHLHYDVIYRGTQVNPSPYLQEKRS
jgi:murein DD-endopeptidase MepM/ murein hydrolase activator NlpD